MEVRSSCCAVHNILFGDSFPVTLVTGQVVFRVLHSVAPQSIQKVITSVDYMIGYLRYQFVLYLYQISVDDGLV